MAQITIPELPLTPTTRAQLRADLAAAIAEKQPMYANDVELWSAVEAIKVLLIDDPE